MSEIEAKERYYWSKIRQALKSGSFENAITAWDTMLDEASEVEGAMRRKVRKTFTAGCNALGDPAPTEEKDHD